MVRYPLSVRYNPHQTADARSHGELADNETNDLQPTDADATAADVASQLNSAVLDETSSAVTSQHGSYVFVW